MDSYGAGMTTKDKKSTLSKNVINLLLIVPSILNVINHIGDLFKAEASESLRHAMMTIMMCFIIALLVTTSWICILAILLIYFTSLHISWSLSLCFILILNTLVLFILILLTLRIKNKIGFTKTIDLLHSIKSND